MALSGYVSIRRILNSVTFLDRHHIPTLSTLLQDLGQATVLSKFDLTSGFNKITVDPDSRDYTTFLAPKGKFRFVRMPFGLKNVPSHFQRTMDKVLDSVKDCSAVYIDNVIIFSSSWEDHHKDLNHVFQQLKTHDLKAKLSKCSFEKAHIEYLGLMVGSGNVVVQQHRVSALGSYKRSITKRTLRSFLGCAFYYRKFIEGFAKLSSLLTPATSVCPKGG